MRETAAVHQHPCHPAESGIRRMTKHDLFNLLILTASWLLSYLYNKPLLVPSILITKGYDEV